MRTGHQTTNAIPTLTQVQTQWEPWKLAEAGEEIKSRSDDFVVLVQATVTQIREASAHWSGDAYYTAYDRIAGDRDTAKTVTEETETIAQALIIGGNSLTGYRQALLDKVTEAIAAGLTVSQDWKVTASADGGSVDDQTLHDHQSAITTALNEMLDTQTDTATKIEQATGEVKARSEALGAGDPIDTDTSSLTSQPNSDPSETLLGDNPDVTTAAPVTDQPGTDPKLTAAGSPISQDQSTAANTDGSTSQRVDANGKPVANATAAQTDEKNTEDKGNGNAGAQPDNKDTKDEETPQPTTPSGSASDPNSWKPSDVTSLINAVGTITGNVPNLIDSVSKLDDNLADILKAGGEAGKNVIEAVGTAAEKVITNVDQAIDNAPAGQASTPSTNTPETTNTPTTSTPEQNTTAGSNTTTGAPTDAADTTTSNASTAPATTPASNTSSPAPNTAPISPGGSSLVGLPSFTRPSKNDTKPGPEVPAEPVVEVSQAGK
ncbi:hypothetical protein AB0E01_02840 [Nocardia vinacea]|uniref:hypothetical protein n=1 Tax=Nocardia vinacea TaxID=96468 RepID=UPI0033D509E6